MALEVVLSILEIIMVVRGRKEELRRIEEDKEAEKRGEVEGNKRDGTEDDGHRSKVGRRR